MNSAVGSFDTLGADGLDPVAAALTAARVLAGNGGVRAAIEALTETNRRSRDPRIEIALVELRHAGFDRTTDTRLERGPADRPLALDTVDGVPRVAPDRLSLGALEAGLTAYGCLLVPELLTPEWVEKLVAGIDRTFEEFDRWQAHPQARRDDEHRAWYVPFRPVEPYAGRELGGRTFTRSTGGIWTVESPRMLFEVIEMLEATGLGALVAGHLGERPVLSAAKCNIRRTPPHIPGGWHQDGSFLGRDIATLDVWIALSDCGRDAAGLDIIPHRFDKLLQAGPDKVVVPHDTVVEAISPLDVEIASPEYRAGDVLIFDHMFLHRTAIAPGMTRERHALETWFFARSRYPGGQIPLVY